MMQKPLSLPLVTPLPTNCIAQPLQNLHVEMTSNTVQAVQIHGAPNCLQGISWNFLTAHRIPTSHQKQSPGNLRCNIGFEVLTGMVMMKSFFLDITPCSPLKVSERFGGTCYLHLRG
jgi:hypothetical protein